MTTRTVRAISQLMRDNRCVQIQTWFEKGLENLGWIGWLEKEGRVKKEGWLALRQKSEAREKCWKGPVAGKDVRESG